MKILLVIFLCIFMFSCTTFEIKTTEEMSPEQSFIAGVIVTTFFGYIYLEGDANKFYR